MDKLKVRQLAHVLESITRSDLSDNELKIEVGKTLILLIQEVLK